jgi:hypothetical protein
VLRASGAVAGAGAPTDLSTDPVATLVWSPKPLPAAGDADGGTPLPGTAGRCRLTLSNATVKPPGTKRVQSKV